MYENRALEIRVIEGIRSGRWRLFTRPLSWGYGLIVRARHWLYDKGIFIQKHAPLPVVSIGNLVLGGVGKTQVALLLAESLQQVAILSRGYRRSRGTGDKPLYVKTESITPNECGDEPWLLASRLPKAQVIVHHNRYKSALAAEKLGAQIILLDDGMQHRQLFRNIEIVVMGGADPFGGDQFLPDGLLRDDPKRLKKADLIVFVGNPSAAILKKVNGLTEAAHVVSEVRVKTVRTLVGEPIGSLEGKKVGLFCGIGNPSRFKKTVEALGVDVVASHYLPDHRTIGKKELKNFASICSEKGAEYLLCTEKDKVKLSNLDMISPLSFGWVEVDLEIVRNKEAWEKITNEITTLAGR